MPPPRKPTPPERDIDENFYAFSLETLTPKVHLKFGPQEPTVRKLSIEDDDEKDGGLTGGMKIPNLVPSGQFKFFPPTLIETGPSDPKEIQENQDQDDATPTPREPEKFVLKDTESTPTVLIEESAEAPKVSFKLKASPFSKAICQQKVLCSRQDLAIQCSPPKSTEEVTDSSPSPLSACSVGVPVAASKVVPASPQHNYGGREWEYEPVETIEQCQNDYQSTGSRRNWSPIRSRGNSPVRRIKGGYTMSPCRTPTTRYRRGYRSPDRTRGSNHHYRSPARHGYNLSPDRRLWRNSERGRGSSRRRKSPFLSRSRTKSMSRSRSRSRSRRRYRSRTRSSSRSRSRTVSNSRSRSKVMRNSRSRSRSRSRTKSNSRFRSKVAPKTRSRSRLRSRSRHSRHRRKSMSKSRSRSRHRSRSRRRRFPQNESRSRSPPRRQQPKSQRVAPPSDGEDSDVQVIGFVTHEPGAKVQSRRRSRQMSVEIIDTPSPLYVSPDKVEEARGSPPDAPWTHPATSPVLESSPLVSPRTQSISSTHSPRPRFEPTFSMVPASLQYIQDYYDSEPNSPTADEPMDESPAREEDVRAPQFAGVQKTPCSSANVNVPQNAAQGTPKTRVYRPLPTPPIMSNPILSKFINPHKFLG